MGCQPSERTRRGHRPRLQVHVFQPGAGADRERHQGTRADPRGGSGLLATPARKNLPHCLRTGGTEPVPVRDGFDPRAGFVGPHGQGSRHHQGPGSGLRRRGTRDPPRTARAADRADQPGHAGGRRRDCGNPGGARNRGRRASRLSWWSANRRSAGTWPSSTRPSPPWTARPAS